LAAPGLAALLCACGGSAGTTVTGNLRGSPLPVADSLSSNVNIRAGNTTLNLGAIVISTMSNLCTNLSAAKETKNARTLLFFVGDYNAGTQSATAPAVAGTYVVSSASGAGGAPPAKFALVTYQETDASCQGIDASRASGASGTITLTSANSGSYAGSFDVTFNDQDHVTGTFGATNCPGLQASVDANTITCM